MNKFLSRRWWLALIYTAAAITGLFTGYLTGIEFVSLSGTVLALYNAANYLGKKNVD